MTKGAVEITRTVTYKAPDVLEITELNGFENLNDYILPKKQMGRFRLYAKEMMENCGNNPSSVNCVQCFENDQAHCGASRARWSCMSLMFGKFASEYPHHHGNTEIFDYKVYIQFGSKIVQGAVFAKNFQNKLTYKNDKGLYNQINKTVNDHSSVILVGVAADINDELKQRITDFLFSKKRMMFYIGLEDMMKILYYKSKTDPDYSILLEE